MVHAKDKVRFHDLTTGICRAELPNPKIKDYRDQWIAPPREGHVVARFSYDTDKLIEFQDLRNGRRWSGPPTFLAANMGVFAPDGRTIAVRDGDGTALLDVHAGAQPRRLPDSA